MNERTRARGGGELPPEEAARVRSLLQEVHRTRFDENRNELARALGRTGPAIGNILNGKTASSLDTAVRLAKLLNVTEQEVRTGKRPALQPLTDPLEVCLAYWEGRWSDEIVSIARRRFSRGSKLSPPAYAALLDEMQAKAEK